METGNRNSEEIEIDLVELIGVLMSKLWMIVLFGALAGAVTYVLCVYVITPQYESTTKMYIINRQSNETLTYSDLQTGTQLTKDYQELVTSRPVLEEVRNELALDMDNRELKRKISVTVPTDTRIVTITVEDSSPETARDIADAIRNSASEHISAVMNTEAVNVVEEADVPTEASSPKVFRNTLIGGMGGVFFAIVVIILIYVMDDTIKNPDDIEHYLKVSVLGSIPYVDEKAGENDRGRKKKKRRSDKEFNSKTATTPVNMAVLRPGTEVEKNGY
ncbi:MAG: protein-tyrosine kinase [Lachnospiraceae bacterium]|nr:protein-tyrosine kinase [Lachnospiraceae bacterium]